MPTAPWTDSENDLIVADYFAMLSAEIAGHSYSKAGRNHALQRQINRGRGSIEYKHQNISAVLKSLGETWIRGYRPAFNFQSSLVDAVIRWLDLNRGNNTVSSYRAASVRVEGSDKLIIEPPPTSADQPPQNEHQQTSAIARKFDVAGRAERNRVLGRAGEKYVLAHEQSVLADAGRSDLAKEVRWVSDEDGDGAGYDIASFSPEGQTRLIEVKTTNGWKLTPFHISRNELAVAQNRRNEWCLLRVWNFAREPRAFELHPPLDAHVTLTATSYEARFD